MRAMRLKQITTGMVLCIGLCPCTRRSAWAPPPVAWPAGAEAVIDKAIAIKKDAQKQNMTMRTEGGVAGIAFGKEMDRLAEILEGKGLEPALREAEGHDLKSKIALWTLDRKQRPAEYARLAELHVNAPVDKASLARFLRRGKPGSDQVAPRNRRPKVGPWEVAPEDAVEANRWILEYHYFAPPTGKEFAHGPARGVLAQGLAAIGSEKSLELMEYDIRTQIEAFPDAYGLDEQLGWPIALDIKSMLDFRTVRAFEITASLLHHPGVRRHLNNLFTVLSKPMPEYGRVQWRDKLEDYRKLADREWKTDAEKELASWIKAIPPMPPAPQPYPGKIKIQGAS